MNPRRLYHITRVCPFSSYNGNVERSPPQLRARTCGHVIWSHSLVLAKHITCSEFQTLLGTCYCRHCSGYTRATTRMLACYRLYCEPKLSAHAMLGFNLWSAFKNCYCENMPTPRLPNHVIKFSKKRLKRKKKKNNLAFIREITPEQIVAPSFQHIRQTKRELRFVIKDTFSLLWQCVTCWL